MTKLEKMLNELPKKIKHEGKVYSLFIYPSTLNKNGWGVDYALGRYYCDANNGCCNNEYGILHGHEDYSLLKAIQGMTEWINENAYVSSNKHSE